MDTSKATISILCNFVFLILLDSSSACQETCPFVWRPVCGSDDVTYANICFLRVSACKGGINVALKHRGKCIDKRPAGKIKRALTEVVEEAKEEACQTFCTLEYAPVCGSNGQTYPNQCALDAAKCQEEGNLELASRGPCPQKRKEPEPEERQENPCNCPLFCTLQYSPHCGSDGKTYGNECMLNAAKCRAECGGGSLELTSVGPCPQKREEPEPEARQENLCNCPLFCTMEYFPLCGSDGITYGNECMLNAAKCRAECRGGSLDLVSVGPCPQKREEPEPEGRQENPCNCPLICTMEYFPLCGSDGNTYGNECGLNAAKCRAECAGGSLELVSTGPCP